MILDIAQSENLLVRSELVHIRKERLRKPANLQSNILSHGHRSSYPSNTCAFPVISTLSLRLRIKTHIHNITRNPPRIRDGLLSTPYQLHSSFRSSGLSRATHGATHRCEVPGLILTPITERIEYWATSGVKCHRHIVISKCKIDHQVLHQE